MKKLFLTMCLALFSMGAFAQEKGDVFAGAQLSYGFDMKKPAIGVKGLYHLTDQFRVDAGVDFWLEKHTPFVFSVNANYLIDIVENFKVYPIAGIGYYDTTKDVFKNGNFLVNLGAGAQYNINDKIGVYVEPKYMIVKDNGQFYVSLGAIYKF